MKYKDIIITDANILFSSDNSALVNLGIQKFIDDYKAEYKVQIYIPEIVLGELIFQKFKDVTDSLRHINGHINKINTITSKKFKHTVTESKLRNSIEKQYYTWINKNHLRTINVPFDTIDWKVLVDSAIWRIAPFEISSNKEKGFRDYLIMESVVNFTKNHPIELIHFISNDTLLRDATTEKLKLNKCFYSYESIDDFINYLNLRSENLTKKFIDDILDKAYKKSFDIIEDKDIINRIKVKFSHLFTLSQSSPLAKLIFQDKIKDKEDDWTSLTQSWIVYKPKFLKKEGTNYYNWSSVISLLKIYERKEETKDILSLLPLLPKRKILRVNFHLNWKTKISSNKKFLDFDSEEPKYLDRTFEYSPTDISKYFSQKPSGENI